MGAIVVMVLLAGIDGEDEAMIGAGITGAGAENDELISALGALGGLNKVVAVAVVIEVVPELADAGADTLTSVIIRPSLNVEAKVVESCVTGAKPEGAPTVAATEPVGGIAEDSASSLIAVGDATSCFAVVTEITSVEVEDDFLSIGSGAGLTTSGFAKGGAR